MADDFSDYPQSIGESKNSMAEWTPREMLINLLRDIDTGEIDPDEMLIVFRPRHIDTRMPERVRFRQTGKDIHLVLGMVEDYKMKLAASVE